MSATKHAAEAVLALIENTYARRIRIISDSLNHKEIAEKMGAPFIRKTNGSRIVISGATEVIFSKSIFGADNHPAASAIPTWRIEKAEHDVALHEWYVSQNLRAVVFSGLSLAGAVYCMYHGWYSESAQVPNFMNGIAGVMAFFLIFIFASSVRFAYNRHRDYLEVSNTVDVIDENKSNVVTPIYRMRTVNREAQRDEDFIDPITFLEETA